MYVSFKVYSQGLADLTKEYLSLFVIFFSMIRLHGGNSRFPRVEDMPHFHYDFVDLGESVKVSWSVNSKIFCSFFLTHEVHHTFPPLPHPPSV